MVKNSVYPNVNIGLFKYDNMKVLTMETFIRLKHKKKYYLTRVFKSWEIDASVEGLALLEYTSYFHADVYKALKFMKVDLKIVVPGHFEPDKKVFELDPDQTPEKERLC